MTFLSRNVKLFAKKRFEKLFFLLIFAITDTKKLTII